MQKLFNGRSKFGLDGNYVKVGSVVLDDAHACIDSIRKAFTIRISRDNELYKHLLNLFWDDLVCQGEGSLHDIVENNFSTTVIAVPYWSWIDNKTEVTKHLSVLSRGNQDNLGDAFFVWPLLRDCLEDCQMFISSKWIEISPFYPRIAKFSSFANASQRIVMSATTQDDSFFIKGLDFSEKSIMSPLQLSDLKWSGEKMIIIPSKIVHKLTREVIIKTFFDETKKSYGTVSLVPSLYYSGDYPTTDVVVSNSDNISSIIDNLKGKNYSNKVVLVNRYDGIDLPDSACRVLIMDSMPSGSMLADIYEDNCRHESDIVRARTAQRIEQGLGRGVRGEKDYCAILIIGAELVRFIQGLDTNKYFSPQTRQQVITGVKLSEIQAEQKGEDPLRDLHSLLDQLLTRDPRWKKYYTDQMSNNNLQPFSHDFYHIFTVEKQAEELHWRGEDSEAAQCIQSLINQYQFVGSERGWYLQLMARYYYFVDKSQSEIIQKSAFSQNYMLFKPRKGIEYSKMTPLDESQASCSVKEIRSFGNYTELHLAVEEYLSKLSFGVQANDFEQALFKIGKLLGWSCSRPDKERREGPDVLFCSSGPQYIAFECKNEVQLNRTYISKREAGQMNNHFGWFERNYGKHISVEFYMIIPTNIVASDADFTQEIRIIRQDGLSKFKYSFRAFIQALQQYSMNSLTDALVAKLIITYKLNIDSFKTVYSVATTRE